MDLLRELLEYGGIAFLIAAILAPFIISVLYQGGIVVQHVLLRSKVNEEFVKLQKHKSGTPTMGGLIIVIPFVILSLLLLPSSPLRNVFLMGFSLFSLYGLTDEMLVKFNLKNEEFRALQETFIWRVGKLSVLFGIGILVAILMRTQMGIGSVSIMGLFDLPFEGIFLLFWGLFITAGTYGAEITDGLDGLVTGLFLVAYAAYVLIVILTGTLTALPILALLIGPMLVYLYFNITPARVFMGGVGAIPLGFGLMFLAILTNTVLPFLVITGVFWVELGSSVIQMISIKYFDRKVFKIAPIHHHFESIGWSEAKIVMRFWLIGTVLALVGLWIFVLIHG
jgi:phospho-N-acetylmuramoyl-pentapeptide-transferase